jgi:hypothetical protein
MTVAETSWVRSVYLYAMCAVSIALIGVGVVGAALGVVHTAAPDLGHRDTLDRVGIGLSNIGSSLVDLFNDTQLEGIDSYCEDVTDSNADFEDCVDDEQAFGEDSMASIQDGIGEVKDELRSQIRNNSIDHVIQGLLTIAAGIILFRIHGPRTEVFAGGLLPARRVTPTNEPPATIPPPPPPAGGDAPLA